MMKFERGNFFRQKKAINHICTVSIDTILGGPYHAAGSLLDASGSNFQKVSSAIFTFNADNELSGGSSFCPRCTNSSSGLVVPYRALRALAMPKRRTRKVHGRELFNRTVQKKTAP